MQIVIQILGEKNNKNIYNLTFPNLITIKLQLLEIIWFLNKS
jgi:hypothetical protein